MNNIRKDNSKKDGLYIIEVVDVSDKEKNYIIMGHSGRAYETKITNKPSCSCPDFKYRRKRCKHIYFVLIRAMKVEKKNEDKIEFTNNDIEIMFNNIPQVMNNLYVTKDIEKKYHDLKTHQKEHKIIKMKPTSDEMCPICLDDLENGDIIDFCKYSCGKPIHMECFGMWTKKHTHNCLFCGSGWNQKVDDEYINLMDNLVI